jgi:hypothetical protein
MQENIKLSLLNLGFTVSYWLHERNPYRNPIFIRFSPFSSLLHISGFCFKVKTTLFHFNSCMWVLGNSGCMGEDYRYTVSRTQIHLAFAVMATVCGNRQTALLVAAGRSIIWHMDLFANYCWLHENSGCLATRYLGVYYIYLYVFDKHHNDHPFVCNWPFCPYICILNIHDWMPLHNSYIDSKNHYSVKWLMALVTIY